MYSTRLSYRFDVCPRPKLNRKLTPVVRYERKKTTSRFPFLTKQNSILGLSSLTQIKPSTLNLRWFAFRLYDNAQRQPFLEAHSHPIIHPNFKFFLPRARTLRAASHHNWVAQVGDWQNTLYTAKTHLGKYICFAMLMKPNKTAVIYVLFGQTNINYLPPKYRQQN